MKSTDCKHGLRKTDCAACTPGGALAYEPPEESVLKMPEPHPDAVWMGLKGSEPLWQLLYEVALCEDGECFTLQDLAVAAWTHFPKRFGLKGYEDQYPDFNAVKVAAYGAKGLIARGLLVRQGKLFTAKEER